jgi:SOS-response transcriptional repressor LexA
VDEARMTQSERLVLEALCRSLRERGAPPTLPQLMSAAGLPSLGAVQFLLENLQRKKLIRRDATQPRVVEVYCGALQGEPAQPASAPVQEEPAAGPLVEPSPEPAHAAASAEAPAAAHQAALATQLPDVPVEDATHDAESDARRSDEEATEEPEGIVFGRGADPAGVNPRLVTVPLLGRVAAGLPIGSVPGEVEAVYQLPRAMVGPGSGLHFMVHVVGASMVGMGIHNGDFAVVHRQRSAENGQVVVACDEHGDAVVKRLWRSDDGTQVELRSADPSVEAVDLAGGELLGRVVTVIRTFERST